MPHAELFVRGARLWSDGAARRGDDSIAVQSGRIVARGPSAALADWIGPATRIVEADGRTLTPGLCDAHIHLLQWARSLDEIGLLGASSRDEVATRLATAIAARPDRPVVVGRGWDANGWPGPPDRASLDRVAPRTPVVLHSKDFHSVWVNGAALERCGIHAGTADPAGGRIVRDPAGVPTGLLLENAVRLVAPLLARNDAAADARLLREAVRRLHALGITSVHDFEGPFAHRLLRDLATGETPGLRVVMHLAHEGLEPARAIGLASGTGDDAFRIGAVKLFADGTLGSGTAAMLAPFEGTANTGMELLPKDDLTELVRRAFGAGLSVAVHAIGDRAVRNVLDAFEASRERIAALALPPRIEHLQLVDPADMARLAALGVGASMQPVHATEDAVMARAKWGTRIAHSYPWRTLLDHGARLAFGSDAPVESPDVALGLAAAVTRIAPDPAARGGHSAFVPEQRVSLDEALSAYTEGAARLGGVWPRLGSLRPGSHADFALWSDDLHALPPERLGEARVALTAIGGRIVHEARALAAAPAGRMA